MYAVGEWVECTNPAGPRCGRVIATFKDAGGADLVAVEFFCHEHAVIAVENLLLYKENEGVIAKNFNKMSQENINGFEAWKSYIKGLEDAISLINSRISAIDLKINSVSGFERGRNFERKQMVDLIRGVIVEKLNGN